MYICCRFSPAWTKLVGNKYCSKELKAHPSVYDQSDLNSLPINHRSNAAHARTGGCRFDGNALPCRVFRDLLPKRENAHVSPPPSSSLSFVSEWFMLKFPTVWAANTSQASLVCASARYDPCLQTHNKIGQVSAVPASAPTMFSHWPRTTVEEESPHYSSGISFKHRQL